MVKGVTNTSSNNQCAFIKLPDVTILNGLKLPIGLTELTLWYRKNGEDFWGLTAKSYDDIIEGVKSTDFSMKITWIYREGEGVLVPTKPSQEFTEKITGELADKLKEIKTKHQERASKKTVKTIIKNKKILQDLDKSIGSINYQ